MAAGGLTARRPAQEVAVKLIREPWVTDGDVLARFEGEARLAARLEHPNVVRVHTVRPLGRGLALVMEYVRGRVLEDEGLADGPLLP